LAGGGRRGQRDVCIFLKVRKGEINNTTGDVIEARKEGRGSVLLFSDGMRILATGIR